VTVSVQRHHQETLFREYCLTRKHSTVSTASCTRVINFLIDSNSEYRARDFRTDMSYHQDDCSRKRVSDLISRTYSYPSGRHALLVANENLEKIIKC